MKIFLHPCPWASVTLNSMQGSCGTTMGYLTSTLMSVTTAPVRPFLPDGEPPQCRHDQQALSNYGIPGALAAHAAC